MVTHRCSLFRHESFRCILDRFRGDAGGWRLITLLLNGSLLDVPYALIHGLLELIDLEIVCKIVIKPNHLARPNLSTQRSNSFQLVDIEEEEDSRVTLRSEDDILTTLAPSAQPQNQFLILQVREATCAQERR